MSEVQPNDTQPTAEERRIRELVAHEVDAFMRIPQNKLNLALELSKVMTTALAWQLQHTHRELTRPYITQVYYKGAFKAVVVENPAPGAEDHLTAELYEPVGDDALTPEWVKLDAETTAWVPVLVKLVLSQPNAVAPGDVFYITQKQVIDRETDHIANAFADELQKRQQP